MAAYANSPMLPQQTTPQQAAFNPQYPPLPETPGNASHHGPVYANVDPQLGHSQGPPPPPPAPKSSKEGHTGEGKARLRKACDACSQRKVKCDESGPPCKACQGLDIECTFLRPSKRRGPPNKVAQGIKRGRYDSPGRPGRSQPSSPTHAAHTLASFSQQQALYADAICPMPILQYLIDEYFMHIHPLVPLPHEQSFRAAFERREDTTNTTFLAMLAAMVGCVVANFPRKLEQAARQTNTEHSFPTSMSLVERCHKVANEAQSVGYLDRAFTIHDAVTNYLLGLTGVYTFNRPSYIMYFRQCLTILTTLGAHKPNITTVQRPGGAPQARMTTNGHAFEGPQSGGVDLLMREIYRRTFWVIFVSARSLQQLGVSQWELPIPPATKSDPYPPLPVEVDDAYLTPTHFLQQPQNYVSELTAFNANVRLYTTYNDLAAMETLYGVDELVHWEQQKRVLERSLYGVKQVLEQLPSELMLHLEGLPAHPRPQKYPSPAPGLSGAQELVDYASSGLDNRPIDWTRPGERNRVQTEIEKANIYTSQISTRLYFVEKYWTLRDADKLDRSRNPSPSLITPLLEKYTTSETHSTMTEGDMSAEREDIVKSFLALLGSMNQINVAANGASFIHKVRQIASTLLDSPHARKGSLALRAEDYLSRSLSILMQLERAPEGREAFEDDEQAQSRYWADLQEQQARFAQA